MTLIRNSYRGWWDDVGTFLIDKVVPALAVVAMFMFLFGFGVTLYIALSPTARHSEADFSYTSWDGHEYVVMDKLGSYGVTHSPRCKCLTDVNKILQEDRKPGIWMYMDAPVTNLPPMYYWEGKPSIMLCGQANDN